ncbi:uncharacterized protein PITG_03507 [Phytophthora infestans T30-4]|uniref:Uncharacterized protein n=1 Tax=Phytophthora infestans (strain T30-4) TaxID=403677 RepID=D0MXS8_PHYIT|nr:uncharacterized protein PITG_03507 [Phytophthora infestans T30-4]EEY65976.1 hypothetical protein PITG_03507 [Phytophthora infestans T30-4]|eukprot:XP_002906575.1 hypothetical protein PITG_03507 [Phytophthora infestans T30-4]
MDTSPEFAQQMDCVILAYQSNASVDILNSVVSQNMWFFNFGRKSFNLRYISFIKLSYTQQHNFTTSGMGKEKTLGDKKATKSSRNAFEASGSSTLETIV